MHTKLHSGHMHFLVSVSVSVSVVFFYRVYPFICQGNTHNYSIHTVQVQSNPNRGPTSECVITIPWHIMKCDWTVSPLLSRTPPPPPPRCIVRQYNAKCNGCRSHKTYCLSVSTMCHHSTKQGFDRHPNRHFLNPSIATSLALVFLPSVQYHLCHCSNCG